MAPKDYDQPFNVLIRKVVAKFNRIVFEGTHGRPGVAFGQQRTVFKNGQDPLETRSFLTARMPFYFRICGHILREARHYSVPVYSRRF